MARETKTSFLPARLHAQEEVDREQPTRVYKKPYVEESDDAVDRLRRVKVDQR